MAKSRFFYLCALLGCFGFYIAYQQWLSWLLLVAALGLPWLSLLVSLRSIRSFRAAAQGISPVTVGEKSGVSLQGGARHLVPPFRGRLRLTVCNTGESWTRSHTGDIPTEHCAGIRVTPEKVFVCDLLGLFAFRVRRVDSTCVMVRPRPLAVGEIPELERFLARSWRPKAGGGYAENHEMRLYRPGDNLNQVHWKLTAKTGKLIIREPLEPNRGLVLLTLDVRGTRQELDRKYGRLLWLGGELLQRGVAFRICALTGQGIFSMDVQHPEDLTGAVDQLLCCPPAGEGTILDREMAASWHRHLGGEPDER